jgi:hypothetical protein
MIEWDNITEGERQKYFDKAVDMLQDHYTCTRVWSSWSYGTMGSDDFHLAAEDDDIVSDTAKMLFDFVNSHGKVK